MSELTFSNQEELRKLALANGLVLPSSENKRDSTIPLIEDSDGTTRDQEFDDDGAIVAEKIRQFSSTGWRPTKEEALQYRDFMHKQETSAWASIAGAIEQTAADLGNAALSLAGDTLSLKIPKVAGSVVEGAAIGTKNWMYMWEEAKYNEDSPIHKLLYKKTGNDDEYYYNLVKTLDVKQAMDKDMREGVLLPKEVEVGGLKFDLWNPATVMGISYVADPSWVAPNLGIESTLAKGMRGAGKILALNEQLANVSVWASKQAEIAAGKASRGSGLVADRILKTEQQLINTIEDYTGAKVFVGRGGEVVEKSDLGRGALSSAGIAPKIPAWGVTTLAYGASKILQTTASAAELAAKIAQEPTSYNGLRLSERLAMESDNKAVRSLAGTWAKTGSPLVEWAGNTTRTSLHSAMYGGAFGFTFGGEEGFYHGIGSGFTIGSAFHQIGSIHGAVAGADAPREVMKNFLWATEGYDFYNKEGVMRLLDLTEKEHGEFAKLRLMGEVAAMERLQRDTSKVILTEQRIKDMLGEDSPEWADLKKEIDNNPDFGGVAFKRNLDGKNVIVINADRAYKFAAKEELFHTLLLDNRYGMEFQRHAIDSLVGTEDAKGALLRMPKEQAVRALEQFKDAYLGLEEKASKGDSARISQMETVWNEAISKFKNGETDGRLSKLFEEFLASYWNAYTEDKPIDYLLRGGDLGVIRNVIETAKDAYKNTMHQDLRASGAKFNFGKNIEGFWLDQNTGKRIVIPELEKLMKHFVQRSSKEMYRGWVRNERKMSSVEAAYANGLDHLVITNPDGSARLASPSENTENVGKGLRSAIEAIAELPESERGFKIIVNGADGESKMAFSKPKNRPKKKKEKKDKSEPSLLGETETTELNWGARQRHNKWWDAQAGVLEVEKDPITKKELQAAESVAGEAPEDGGWSVDKRKKFWKSVWNGNPRITIRGVASRKELAILEQFLPHQVVNKFKHLNSVIEMSRAGAFAANASNILTAEVVTETKGPYNKVSNREEGPFTEQRNFQPAELKIYFERKRTKRMEDGEVAFDYQSGEARLLLEVIDHDAILTRVDHFYDEAVGDLDYKEVRRLFSSKEDLYLAAKSLLSRYSNSKIAEGGIAIFRNAGAVSVRDAGRMRTIVNGVLGFHPTKAQMRAGQYANPWHELQLRKQSQDADLPQVIKDFRVDRIGRMRSRDGEGFYYDHSNAVQRSQYNFSPAKSFRDHEGNPMSKAEIVATRNSVYRNREGEVLSVYSLNKPLQKRFRVVSDSIFDYVDESFGGIVDIIDPRSRGRMVTSESGWLHYTPDMSEASINSNGRMSTGYIDTTRHLDLSNIDHNSTPDVYLKALAQGISKITGRDVGQHLDEILALRDIDGNRLSSLIDGDVSPFKKMSENIETYLFTKSMSDYFKKNDIHSMEYIHFNPVRQQATSAIAVWDNGRFIENRSRAVEANYFAFSPSKKREVEGKPLPPNSMLDILNKRISELKNTNIAKGMSPDDAALEAFMALRVDENGDIVENRKQITEAQIQGIIDTETAKYQKLLGKDLGKKFFDEKGRQEINSQLKPLVVKSLRQAMPFAPNKILGEIADIALAGMTAESIHAERIKAKPLGEKGRGKTSDLLVVRDGVIGRFKKHYQMSAEKIKKGYGHSLFEAVEMTEGEFQLSQKLPEFLDHIKKGTSEKWISDNMYTVHKLFGEYGGLKGFRDMHKGRERDIFLLMEKGLQRDMEDTGGNKFKVLNHEALKELYAARTRQFVYETLSQNKMTLQNRNGLLKTYQKYRNISAETAELRASFRAYNDTINAFIKDEFNQRVIDTMTALNLPVKIDSEVLQQVRASLYRDAKQGLYKLGSYDAISQSVHYYYRYSENKGLVVNERLALQKNLVESLHQLEKAGFVGINFTLRPRAYELKDGQKAYKPHTVEIISPNGVKGQPIDAFNVWDFDGTYFKVVEAIDSGTGSVLKLIDTRNGREILTEPVFKEGQMEGDLDRNKTIETFIRESTARIHKEVPSTVLNTHFGKIDGPMKSYIMLNHEVQQYGKDPSMVEPEFRDWSNYELYKNGNYFVAVQKFKSEAQDSKVNAQIEELRDKLIGEVKVVVKNGKKTTTRVPPSLEQQVFLRETITELQKKATYDYGLVMEVDDIGRITVIDKLVTLSQQNLALSRLKKGNIESHALQFYVGKLYEHYIETQKARKLAEKEKISRVLSDGKQGNIAKIKELESRIRSAESDMKTLIGTKVREMNAELKKAGIKREATAMEAYKRIKMDLDSLRKNSDNANARIIALERTLVDIAAFPEYAQMSPERQRIFNERISEAGKDEWVPNPLTGKLELTQSDWVQKNVARLPNEGNIDYATRLRKEYSKQRSIHEEYSTRYEQLSDIIDRKSAVVNEIEDQLVFLVRQYGRAKGIVISEKTALDLITSSKVNDELNNVTTINIGKLVKFTGKKVEPVYLPDSKGVLPDKKGKTGVPERFETSAEYKEIFANMLANVSENFADSRRSMTLVNTLIERQGVLKGRGKFQEAPPLESQFTSPRQFREAFEIWQERKTAFENNYLQVLGSTESSGVTKGSPYKAVGLDGLPIKRFTQKSTHETNARMKSILEGIAVEWGSTFRDATVLAKRRKNNTEFDFGTEFESLISDSQKLSFKQEAWVRDAANRERVLELQKSLADGTITEQQLIQTIKDEAYLTSYGQEGFELTTADNDLVVVRNKIIENLDRIDSINYGKYRSKYDPEYVWDKEAAELAIAKIEERLVKLREDEDALNTRINSIINGVDRATGKNRYERALVQKERIKQSREYKQELVKELKDLVSQSTNAQERTKSQWELRKATEELDSLLKQEGLIDDELKRTESSKDEVTVSDSKNSLFNSEEFRSLVDRVLLSRKANESNEVERVRRNKERVELAKMWAEDYKKFLDMFREDARELGISQPEIIVSPNNPRTRHLFNSFARVTYDLYGSMHPLDWSGSGYNIEYTEKGEQLVKFRGNQDPAGLASYEEQSKNRRAYTVADYMYFASKRAEYHMLHPEAPMSADDYMLISTLVPKRKYTPSEEKVATINKTELAKKRRLSNGILDNTSIPENKQKLVRAFVRDGISLVLGSKGERLRALQRISGMDDAQWNKHILNMTEDEILKSAMTREVVENAFYWITDGYIPLTQATQESVKMMKKDGTVIDIRTKQMDIQRLIEFEEFVGYMDEELDSQKLKSAFDTMPYAKAVYETMAPEERMQLGMDTISRLSLENSAEMLRQQSEVFAARGEKPIWFGGEFHQTRYTGRSRDTLALEQERIGRLISETTATEASIQKYKGAMVKLCQTRTRAVEHMLSLEDGVSFPDLNFRETDGIVKESDSWKESVDGRYIIQRVATETKGEHFRVYYIGETIKNKDGGTMYDIPTSKIGNVENTTQAQVLVRLFEDDIQRVKQTSRLVSGGDDAFDYLRVGDVLIAKEGAGAVLQSAWDAPAFSKAVIAAYKKAGARPENVSDLQAIARPLYDFGETQRVRFTANGQVKKKEIVITPSREGVLSKYFDRTVGSDGMVQWIQKPRNKAPAQPDVPMHTQDPSVSESNPNANTQAPSLREPTKEESIVSDASEFSIISNKSKDGQPLEEWDVIKNRLGYQMVRLKDENGKRDVFKLFNPASAYLGKYYDEMEAVDEIVRAEIEKLHANE